MRVCIYTFFFITKLRSAVCVTSYKCAVLISGITAKYPLLPFFVYGNFTNFLLILCKGQT